MADRNLILSPGTAADMPPKKEARHCVMAYIAALWPGFGAGKSADQKKQMIAAWEQALADIPPALQKVALDERIKAGQIYPPSSPAELRRWCNAVQQPMNEVDAAMYRTAMECGLLDADFCQRQIAKYHAAQAAGAAAYAGWDR